MPNNNKRAPNFKILSLDGGGIRGVCPATFLAEIEDRLENPIHEYFDLIVGTSTGGIIAAAISSGIRSEVITQLYLKKGKELFDRRFNYLPKKVSSFLGSIYRSHKLHSELKKVIGEKRLLGEALTNLCIPAINITTGEIIVFKTSHHPDFIKDHKVPMWKVAAATAAAPIFFEPVRISGYGNLVDGGIWANNPSLVGIIEGLRLGYRIDQIQLLSIGTGVAKFYKSDIKKYNLLNPARYIKSFEYGLVGWGTSVVGLSFQSQTQRGRNISKLLLDTDKFTRVQFKIPDEIGALDAVDKVSDLYSIASEQAKWEGQNIIENFFSNQPTKTTRGKQYDTQGSL